MATASTTIYGTLDVAARTQIIFFPRSSTDVVAVFTIPFALGPVAVVLAWLAFVVVRLMNRQ